jgi:acylphosphatase
VAAPEAGRVSQAQREPLDTERIEVRVRGVVQGVGFRWFVVRRASELGIVGWTANEADGSVRVIAEGGSQELERLVGHLHKGPPGARVESVDVVQHEATGEFSTFGIKSGAHRGD